MTSSSTVAMEAALCAFGGRAVPLYPRGPDAREEPLQRNTVDVLALWDEYRWVAVALVILLLLYVVLGDEARAPDGGGAGAEKKEGGPSPSPPAGTGNDAPLPGE